MNCVQLFATTVLIGLSFSTAVNAADTQACEACVAAKACDTNVDSCIAICTRLAKGDQRLASCSNACRAPSNQCIANAKTACKDSCRVAPRAAMPTPAPAQATEAAAAAPTTETTVATSSSETAPSETSPSETASENSSDAVAASTEAPTTTLPVASSEPTPAPAPPAPVPQAPTPPVQVSDSSAAVAQTKPAIPSLNSKRAMMQERETYTSLLAAVRFSNLKVIRSIVQGKKMSPTYVYAYEFSPETRQFEGSITRLWLNDILNDSASPVGNAANADRTLALFLELGMDINATSLVTVPLDNGKGTMQVERTAWGPSLRAIEKAKDRDAYVRALDIAMKAGLKPNPEIGNWLFTELPQVCGRDRSKFAIQVVDLLVQHLGRSLQDSFWRLGPNGPETVADIIDRSFSRAVVQGTAYEKEQMALQEQVWENCAALSQRITRYLSKGT